MITPNRILVLGSGGREHAIAWRLAQDAGVEQVIVAPGNAGIAHEASHGRLMGVWSDTDPGDHPSIARRASEERIDLVVVGPEAPLVAGLAELLRDRGIAVFGPGRAGAALEGSKAFCREVAEAAGIPMAEGRAFEKDEVGAIAFARALGDRVVVKADGLASGKGVTVCASLAEAEAAILECRPRFGAAGQRIVVERALEGREVSVIVVTDGRDVIALPPARDHKRAGDGDRGPNTGGMGAFSPVPDVPDTMADDLVMRTHRPVLRELAVRGIEYRGALYAGLMLTADGPYLLEFNVRFGDPETQVLLPRLDGPFAAMLLAAARGALTGMSTDVTASAAVGVVLAAAGYPDSPRMGDPIMADDLPDGPTIRFWSGVQASGDGGLVTAGGRVATIVGLGPDLEAAADAAYGSLDPVRFEGRHFRRDIGRTTVMAGAAT